ncbi:MAG: hypothetical protein IPP35_05650 [Elusimicrobia bacterium]|nr:hypothetical protein [Elusimicrobiota bacterium]
MARHGRPGFGGVRGGAVTGFLRDGRPVLWGVGLAAVLVIPSYWALSLTLRLSDRAFFGAFIGGIFGRMSGLAVGVALVWSHEREAVVPFALAAVGSLIALTWIELIFLGRQNRGPG